MSQFAPIVHAYAAGDPARAAALATTAATAAPSDRLLNAAAQYLQRVQRAGEPALYVSGEAFGAFIRGGGNVALYQTLSAQLRAVYAQLPPFTLLDIGAGDGLALLPALTPNIRRIDIAEPAAALLAQVCAALDARGVPNRGFPVRAQEIARRAREHWGIAQATFSLHNIPRAERIATLQLLRHNVGKLLIAEFDVPDLFDTPTSDAAIAYVSTRYAQGLAEYEHAGDLVAQGFLMPIMFGYFAPGGRRSTYEQPIEEWIADLRAAGFSMTERTLLHRYWWADAYLLAAW
jgi:hypothetical protein